MAHTFSDVSSSNRKKVIEAPWKNLSLLNISLAYNGLFRFDDNLVCGRSRTDGTDVLMFNFEVDLIAENPGGPPTMTLKQLDGIIRRDAFEKSIMLPIEKYSMFIVRKNGTINISSKKTPKVKMIVDKPDPNLLLVPGSIANPDAEKRMLFLFYGDPEKAKADMGNHLGGSKALNDAKIYRTCELACSQLALNFNDSKTNLPDYIKDFSFKSSLSMQSLLHLARDMIIKSEAFADISSGKLFVPFGLHPQFSHQSPSTMQQICPVR